MKWLPISLLTSQVVNVGPGDLRMFYHSYDAQQQRYRVGLATSPDGFGWTKQGPVFDGGLEGHDAHGAATCHVVFDYDLSRWVVP